MKATINGIELEGTASEIAKVLGLYNANQHKPKEQPKPQTNPKEDPNIKLPDGVNVALVTKSPDGITKRYSSVDDFLEQTGLKPKSGLIKRILKGETSFYWHYWYIIPDYTEIDRYYNKLKEQTSQPEQEQKTTNKRYYVKATDTSGNSRIYQSISQFCLATKIPISTFYVKRKGKGDKFTIHNFSVELTDKYKPVSK